MQEQNALENISIATKALENVKDITEILDIRSKASAMQAWATARGAEGAAQFAMEIKLRAERKAGEFLKEMKDAGEFGKGKKSVKLTDLKIDQMESKRWQQIASIPQNKFEDYISSAQSKTQASLLQIATKYGDKIKTQPPEEEEEEDTKEEPKKEVEKVKSTQFDFEGWAMRELEDMYKRLRKQEEYKLTSAYKFDDFINAMKKFIDEEVSNRD